MAGKFEKWQQLATSVDDCIDEKKKSEGAEGLWRIHDNLYDFTLWSRTHPGGKFWINVTRGTDITEVFESHHLSNKAESLLHKYYRREAAIPRNFTTFNKNGFYKAFKKKISEKELTATDKHSFTDQLISDCLLAAVFLTGFLAIRNGFFWSVPSGVFLGLLSISSHSFFHSRENWRVNYFDLSLMSSRDWKIRHVLSHHQYRDTISDLEIPIWKTFSGNHQGFFKYIQLTGNLLMYFFAAHLQLFQRCFNVFLSKKLEFNKEELVWISFPLFLYLFGGKDQWEVFVIWNVIVMISSFCFCILSSSFYIFTSGNFEENTQREREDFGVIQLSQTGNHLGEHNYFLSFLNSFRGSTLHYLCPRINCGSLHKLIPVLQDTIQEVGTPHSVKSPGFLEGFESKLPRGYVFFS